MAVYTKLEKEEIDNLFSKYNLGKIYDYHGIKEGIENTNYLIKSEKGKFILTLYEKRVDASDLPFFMGLMRNLHDSKFKCPEPIINRNGNYISEIKNKKAAVVSFVEGSAKKKLSPNNCYEIGVETARMHKITQNIKGKRPNTLSLNSWSNIYSKIETECSNIDKTLSYTIKNSLAEINKNWPKNLPSGIIHADLFQDNIFFKNDKFSGFIDFYFACYDFYGFEIAICINALCFDKKNRKFIFNKKKSKNLLKGYSSLRKLSKDEKNSLNVLCRGAALRYLLTRTYDYLNTPKSAIIKIKNPREYIQKLKIHNKFNNFKNYYN